MDLKNWLVSQQKTLADPRPALWIGLVIFVFSLAVFGVLAYQVVQTGPLDGTPTPRISAIHRQALAAPGWEATFWSVMGYMGRWVIIVLGLLLGIYWITNKMWRELAMLVIGVMTGSLWFLFISSVIGRQRPEFANTIQTIPFPSFPSGHMISSITFYGLLLYLYGLKLTRTIWLWVILVVFLVLIGLIGYSRLFLGDHYLLDVLAGAAFGLAWSSLVYPAVDWYVAHNTG